MKPIAWIDEETTCFVYSQSEYEELSEYDKGGLIPLYTAPQGDGEVCGGCGAIRYDPICEPAPKELSDEEIVELIPIDPPIDGAICGSVEGLLVFARAILKKASEK